MHPVAAVLSLLPGSLSGQSYRHKYIQTLRHRHIATHRSIYTHADTYTRVYIQMHIRVYIQITCKRADTSITNQLS